VPPDWLFHFSRCLVPSPILDPSVTPSARHKQPSRAAEEFEEVPHTSVRHLSRAGSDSRSLALGVAPIAQLHSGKTSGPAKIAGLRAVLKTEVCCDSADLYSFLHSIRFR
jgi:hypothetical protein